AVFHVHENRQETLERSNVRLTSLSHDGSILAAAADSGLSVIDLSTKKEMFMVQQGAPIRNAVFSPDNRYLVTSAENNSLMLSEMPDGRVVWWLKEVAMPTNLLFSHDGRILAAGTDRQPAFTLMDAATASILSSIQVPRDARAVGAAFSDDSSYFDIADEM